MDERRSAPALSRRSLTLTLVLALVVTASMVPGQAPAAAKARPNERLAAYRGLGTWVDIFDDPEFRRPVRAVEAMAARGVRTLYLQTSNYRQKRAIVRPKATERLIHAAHERGMFVVAWYLPGFQRLRMDRRRSMKAIRFRTARGEGFDSFGLDIEDSTVTPASRRTRRLLKLSRRIRQAVGPDYPLSAIIPAPRGMQLKKDYWPGFPFAQLAEIYDVFQPMGYWSYRTSGGREFARDYTRRNVQIIRRKTGDPAVPIHPIGGVSDDVTRAEVRGFVRAAREHGVLGASLYDFGTTTRWLWKEMASVPVNPYQAISLPIKVGDPRAVGNIPGGDRSHPGEVWFRSGGRAGDWRLILEAFDVQPGEVQVLVNWRPAGVVAETPPGTWGGVQSISIPDGLLHDSGRNVIGFVAAGTYPSWSEWGVRGVSLSPGP